MSRSTGRIAVLAVWVFVATLLMPAAVAADPPDSELNPVTGAIETADATLADGNYEIRHVTNYGPGQNLVVVVLTSNGVDDVGPRLAIDATTGDTWVLWWRDGATDQVLFRRRTNASGAWSAERVLSDPGLSARKGRIAHDGTDPWAAYEADGAAGSRSIIVSLIPDDPDPIPPGATVGTTTNGGELDLTLQSESGQLWVTWVDSASQVGWTKRDHATGLWSAVSYESYAADSVAAARTRIRARVLGG